MDTKIVRERALSISKDLGRGALHATSPDDFEFYACTLELVDSDFNVLDIFHFPVMPTGVNIGRQSLVSIRKTGRGFFSQYNESFVGNTISINGTFGRKFRLMVSTQIGSNFKTGKGGQFDLRVKTGYGALKLMERIINKSFESKNGRPLLLLFHNMAFNQSFVVEVLQFNPTQSMENNMMWNYSLEMKALADVNKMDLESSNTNRLVNLLSSSVINSGINDILKNVTPGDIVGEIKELI